jgi:hypothetical protein
MSEPIKKIDIVRAHISAGQYKKALAIVKTFRPLRGGASKQELDAMTLAYECMIYPEMYRQLGRDIEQTINNGVACLIAKYAQ